MSPQNFIIQVVGWLIGLPLEFLIVSALVRGPYRLFPLVFIYASVNFVTTLVEIPTYLEAFVSKNWTHAVKVYWINEWILQVLIFAVVLSLLDQATSASRGRRTTRLGLVVGSIVIAGISFYVHYLPPPVKFGLWMTPWTRDLNFCAAILDLALWMVLIASRTADRRLLLISGALGMQFTGEAIGEAIRYLVGEHVRGDHSHRFDSGVGGRSGVSVRLVADLPQSSRPTAADPEFRRHIKRAADGVSAAHSRGACNGHSRIIGLASCRPLQYCWLRCHPHRR